jgi:hypothetical protein
VETRATAVEGARVDDDDDPTDGVSRMILKD